METFVDTWLEQPLEIIESEVDRRASWVRRETVLQHARLGSHVFIGLRCELNWVEIGDYTQLAARTCIQGTREKPVSLGTYCWLGGGVKIAAGCQIGEGAVIGAGCWLEQDVAPYSIVLGRPGRVVGQRHVHRDGSPDFSDFLAYMHKRHEDEQSAPFYNNLPEDAQIGENCFLSATLQACSNLKIGDNVTLIGRPDATGRGGISVGKNVHIGAKTIMEGAERITLGDDLEIGQNVLFLTTTHDYRLLSLPQLRQPIWVGDQVQIEQDVIILSGVKIHESAHIKAGSVVTKDVPAGAIIAGVPAKAQ